MSETFFGDSPFWRVGKGNGYCDFAYSALACFRMGDVEVSVFPDCEPYATTTEARSAGFFAGASAINITPMTMKRATPTSSLRGIKLRDACTAISVAWAKLDHAVKAIRLRCSDGLRAANSTKIPRVT